MANGLRALDIASLNPDSVIEEQMQRGVIKYLNRSKIRVDAVQETHITHDRNYLLCNYRIITAEGTKIERT